MLTQTDYLNAMGIDIWVSRRQPAPETLPAAELTAGKPQSAQRLEQDTVATEVPEPVKHVDVEVPEFSLGLLHYGSIGLCLYLEPGIELPRRLCDDIAGALGGDRAAARFQLLEWPMLTTAGIDQSINAARQVVTQKFAVLPEKVVVIGSETARYYGPVASLEHFIPALIGQQQLMLIPSLAGLMKSADDKRKLMLTIHRWRTMGV